MSNREVVDNAVRAIRDKGGRLSDEDIANIGYALKVSSVYLDAEEAGRVYIPPFAPGDEVWVVRRDRLGNPSDVSAYQFIASSRGAIIVSPFIEWTDDIDEVLDIYIKDSNSGFTPMLEVYPKHDCFASQEQADNIIRKGN